MSKLIRSTLLVGALAMVALAPVRAVPFPSYYDSNCSACHGTTTAGGVQTCNGCHSHGTHPDSAKSSINLTGATSKASYAPGETVAVTINSGYRTGWVRAILYDQNLRQLARSGGTPLPGFIAPCCGPGFPITLSAPAPTTPGTYTWWVAWYGNQYDASGAAFGPNWTASSNPGHGEERVQTNSFTVVAAANPVLALSPASLAFGSVNVGATASLTATVQNTGNAALTVSAIARCSATSTDFTWSPAAPITIQPGQSSTLTVAFAPTAAVTESGCINLTSNDPTSPVTALSVNGTGAVPAAPAIALSPASLSFGTVSVGASATLPTQVQNTGTAPLSITAIAPCSGTSGVFTWAPAAPFTVAVGGSTNLAVTYTPTAATASSGCLTISSNDPQRPTVNLNVAGNGALPAAPAIAFSPTTLDFGTVTIGNSVQRTAQIQDTGTAALTVTSVTACSGAGPEFTWSFTTPATIQAGQSMPITVTYTPTNTDAHSACLAIASNDPARPVANLAITAQGAAAPTPAVALVPASLDFASVQVGSSAVLVSQIGDTGGAPLHVTSIAPCSGTSSEFTWSPPAPFTVSPATSQALSVTFSPSASGPVNGCLAIATDDPLNPTVNLGVAGTGVTTPMFPAIALAPSSLDFGTVTVGGTASRTTQVQNTGTATLSVMGVTACTGTSTEFAWSPTTPFDVAPGQSATLRVTYAPTGAGQDSGCLTVASNDPGNPTVRLELQGTGTAVQPGALDVDIVALRVPEEIEGRDSRTITPKIDVRNSGRSSGSAPVRLVATLASVTTYDKSVTATLDPGARTTLTFPAYQVPTTASGVIRWTATVMDGDGDLDQATARTTLGSGGGDGAVGGGGGGTDSSPPGVAASSSTPAAQASMVGGCSTGVGADGLALVAALAAVLRTFRRRDGR